MLRMPVEECMASLITLSRRAFKPRIPNPRCFLSKMMNILLALTTGSLYPSRNLDASLISLFGRDRTLQGVADQSVGGTKVMVTVTEKSRDGRPEGRVISNFGRGGKRKQPLGYEHIQSGPLTKRIKVWEA